MSDTLRVTVADGKYTVVQGETGGLKALRYNEEWRDCCGDGLIHALASEVERLRDIIRKESARESQVLYVAKREYDYEGFQIIGLYSTEAAAQKACVEDTNEGGCNRGDSYGVEGFKVQD